MPTTAEVALVAAGVAAMLLCIIAYPLLALLCRRLRGRESQIRRWGPANHLLVPPCYCYLTVWVELCPCLESKVQKFLPKDLSKTGHVSMVMEMNGLSTKSARAPSSLILPPDPPPTERPPGSPEGRLSPDGDSSSPIMQITVASQDGESDASVLDHGHVNMAMEHDTESTH